MKQSDLGGYEKNVREKQNIQYIRQKHQLPLKSRHIDGKTNFQLKRAITKPRGFSMQEVILLLKPWQIKSSAKLDKRRQLKFIPSSTYHKEEATIKSTKAHYPSNPKREVRKETPKLREEAFVCMFCGRAGHLDEFYFWRKRIERSRVEYARDSYHDEFIDFLPRSYSHVSPRFYSRASSRTFPRPLPLTSSGALPQFAHGPNHRSYSFGT
jgi:hypothetical protein